MSNVTNIIVSIGHNEDVEPLITQPFVPDMPAYSLRPITDDEGIKCWGGNKAPEVWLYAAAINGTYMDELFAFLDSLPWENRWQCRVFINRQDDTCWSAYWLDDDGFRCLLEAHPE